MLFKCDKYTNRCSNCNIDTQHKLYSMLQEFKTDEDKTLKTLLLDKGLTEDDFAVQVRNDNSFVKEGFDLAIVCCYLFTLIST